METSSEYVTVTMTKTVAEKSTIAMSLLEYNEVKQDAAKTALAQLTEANATIETLQDAAKEKDAKHQDVLAQLNQIKSDRDSYFEGLRQRVAELEAKDAEIATLKARIAELEFAQPPVTPVDIPPDVITPKPPEPVNVITPTITKTELTNVAGFCITLGLEEPSPAIDAAARDLMAIGKRMGFNNVRFFRNKDEVASDVGRSPDDPRNLYSFAHKQGFSVTADTVDRAALDFEDNELAAYIGGLKRLGAVLLVFNDANQYRTGRRKDGTPYPANTLEAMVSRVRDLTDLPIMASLTAGATIADYKPLFDFVEAQTFGSTGNLDTFLDRGFDAYCLPAEAKNSVDYFRKAHDIILNDNPAAFWYYTALDKRTDWRDMTDKTALIEKTVKAWNAARIVKAQPVL